MLYATTRNSEGNYTAHKAFFTDRAPDGGFFVPYRPPYFYQSNLKTLRSGTFLQAEAHVLNTLLGTSFTDWDLLYAGGKTPVQILAMGRRTFTGERWRNTDWTFNGYVNQIAGLFQKEPGEVPGTWGKIAAGIAVIFAMVLELQKKDLLSQGESLDVAVSGEDLTGAVSCLYAKAWGLPLGRIVCGCRESKGLWQLIHDGEMHTDILEPDSYQVDGLENLLLAESYQAEVRRFLNCVRRGKAYVPADSLMRRLREDLGVSIIGDRRQAETIPGVYATKNYLLSMDGALAYAGLLDHRAVTGTGNKGLVLCDECPDLHMEIIASELQMDPSQVRKLLIRK